MSYVSCILILFLGAVTGNEETDFQDIRLKCIENLLLDDPANLKHTEKKYIHTSIILAHVQLQPDNQPPQMIIKLKKFVSSLLGSSVGSKPHLIFLTDHQSMVHIQRVIIQEIGRSLSENIIRVTEVKNRNWMFPRSLKVEFVSLEYFSSNYRTEIGIVELIISSLITAEL
ncbi:uncharacterized protein LOC111711490 [Eurytemora carolleeae]|uniref:uncharacterized protein LOC111711490 n=1 Tax=Eurytemora carolleeae TaxID=1294199 RepID=UPI000C755B32|nr:uncharacterized protein LOC111711490 [Eurytemora carolleeae]|eukprot:XP_023341634.1 uncharacterized protein LOC111711490 [Eurytemora affinis]